MKKVFGWPAGAEIDPVFGDITKFIDYNLLYEEKFMKPLNSMCNALENINPVKKNSLASFFG